MNIFKDDENLLPNVTSHTKLLGWSGLSLSHSREQKFVTLLVERAIRVIGINFNEILIKGKEI